MVFNGKKGFFSILLLVIMLVFAFGMISLLIGKAFGSISELIEEDTTLSEQSKNATTVLYDRYDNTMDGAFAFVMVMMYLLLLFISYQSANSPFLKVVVIVVMILMVVAAMLLTSIYDEVSEDDDLTSEFSRYTFTNWALSNFGVVVLIFIISMFAMMGVGGRYA